jgi:hypothetical protein
MAGLMNAELEKYSEGSCLSIIELDVLKKATIIVVMAGHAFGIEH